MGGLRERLEAAKAELARLEREAAQASCAEVGHRWESTGGANCGCHQNARCSVPVHHCKVCGDCDYGDNPDANDKRNRCEFRAAHIEVIEVNQEDNANGTN